MSNIPAPEEKVVNPEPQAEHTLVEEIELAGNQLVERIKELVAEGNVRRLIIRTAENRTVLEIPLTAGVAGGGDAGAPDSAGLRAGLHQRPRRAGAAGHRGAAGG